MDSVSGSWSELKVDILILVILRLSFIDQVSFRSVCRLWRFAFSQCYTKLQALSARTRLMSYVNDGSFLLHSVMTSRTKSKGDPLPFKPYRFHIPELQDTVCLASNFGWLLLRHGTSIFFLNPFTRSRMDLPPLNHQVHEISAFSSPPISPDCVVLILQRPDAGVVQINTCERGHMVWTTQLYSSKTWLSDPARYAFFMDGCFYLDDSTFIVKVYDVAKGALNKAIHPLPDYDGLDTRRVKTNGDYTMNVISGLDYLILRRKATWLTLHDGNMLFFSMSPSVMTHLNGPNGQHEKHYPAETNGFCSSYEHVLYDRVTGRRNYSSEGPHNYPRVQFLYIEPRVLQLPSDIRWAPN
ncbi:hypothetical protein Ancab_013540 [Ancistrocladus abbreviatus]